MLTRQQSPFQQGLELSQFTRSSVLTPSMTPWNCEGQHGSPSHVAHPMHQVPKPALVLFPLCKCFCIWPQQILVS